MSENSLGDYFYATLSDSKKMNQSNSEAGEKKGMDNE